MFRKLFLNVLFCSLVFCFPLENFLGDLDDLDDNAITEEEKGTDLSYLGELIFGRPSSKTGEKLATWDADSEVNPEEVGEYVEGDILFLNDKRNGLVAEGAHWENGEIPYAIEGIFTPADLALIKKAIGEYHRLTCIKYPKISCCQSQPNLLFFDRFRKRQIIDLNYVAITNNKTGCWSSVGKTGGRQELNLQSPGCLSKIGTPIHELMHAVGFTHEQNRWERDDFVDILWNNIQSGNYKSNMTAVILITFNFDI